jgi:hypothetical protein
LGFWISLGLNIMLVFLVMHEQSRSHPQMKLSQA